MQHSTVSCVPEGETNEMIGIPIVFVFLPGRGPSKVKVKIPQAPTYLSCFNICGAKGVPENGMPIKIHHIAPFKWHYSSIVKVEDRRGCQQNVPLKGFPHSGAPISLPHREPSVYGVSLLMERGTPWLEGQGSRTSEVGGGGGGLG